MELAYGLEEAVNNAKALEILLLATTEAAFNGSYRAEDYEKAFYYLCDMAYKQSQGLEELKEKAFKLLQEEKEQDMENKEKIIKALKDVLVLTRAGEGILELILSKAQDKIIIIYKNGHFKNVNIEADSGIAIVKDVIKKL